MPTLRDIVDDWYERAWGAHKSGSKGKLPELERSPLMWRKSSPWRCTPDDIRFSKTKESAYTDKVPAFNSWMLEQEWKSVRLGLFRGHIAGEEQLNPLIPRMNSKNVIKRLKARVKSSGLKASMVLKQELASLADNTLFIEATLEDGAALRAAVWFERDVITWRLQTWCGLAIRDLAGHPALQAIYTHDTALQLDNGLQSLRFNTPMLIESTVVVMASATTMPILKGAHYYVGFAFGANLQRAVRKRMPQVLISDQVDATVWRSTPFNLEFANVSMTDCQLLVQTQQLQDGDSRVWDSRCRIIGRGLDRRRYCTELGSDTCILRWNLILPGSVDFDPSDVHETDDERNARLAGEEEDFFLETSATYPPLQAPERYDPWMGGADWRSGAVTSRIYGALSGAQFLHLQFGIDLSSLKMTDAALMFRGTLTFKTPHDAFVYKRSLFRIAVGQPFNDELRRISHESHLRMTINGIACEGFFEPGEDRPMLNLGPMDERDIPALAAFVGITLPGDAEPPVDHLTLRINLATGKRQVFVTNDVNVQLLDPEEDI